MIERIKINEKIESRNNNYEDELINEKIIEKYEKKEYIIGITYERNEETKNFIKLFDNEELNNLYEYVKTDFGENLDILDSFKINMSQYIKPSFRCSIIGINKEKEKYLYNVNIKKGYSLLHVNKLLDANFLDTFYLIKFINKKMIVN